MFENSLRQLLITISQFQQKLQSYRQLLNQQIQFNIKDLYIRISGNSAHVTAYHMHVFLTQNQKQNTVDIAQLQSVIKGYNNCTSMNLSFIEFAIMFLSRQNRLLAKLALQRNSLGDMPLYLCDYVQKIIRIQCQLHKILIQFRKNYSIPAEKWIKQNSLLNEQSGQQQFDQSKLKQMCNDIQVQYQPICRYFKINDKQTLKCQKMLSLLTLKNCKKINQYLKKVQNTKSQIDFKSNKDPFIRPQFHDCLDRPKTIQNFSFREIKSIEKHFQRLNSKNKNQLQQKISFYRKFIEKQLKIVLEAINDIIWLQKQIQFQRIQLCLCTDFYPILFFDSFNKDRQEYLIPSSLQNYLEKLGIKIELNSLYTIFKRYSSRSDGKLNFNQFCSIFDVCNIQYTHIEKNRQIRNLQDIDISTIKMFLKLIKILAKNESKIQKIKSKLQTEVNLRQIFYVFDGDEDGYISMLDFKIVWKKFLLMQLKQQQIMLFWHRMKLPKDLKDMIRYEKFMSQMAPKSPWIQKNVKLKNKTRIGK